MMAEPAFTPEMKQALDSYVVPAVPAGFTDRLLTRIATDAAAGAAAPRQPVSRQRRVSPWRRTSRIVGSFAVFSLATATAAATGLFGNPVYLPVISEALDKADIVALPKAIAAPRNAKFERDEPAPLASPVAAAPLRPTGRAAIVERIVDLREDPEFTKLPPRQKRAVAAGEIRKIVQSGQASRGDVRAAFREVVRDASPAEKAAWRQAIAERRQILSERRERQLERRDPISLPSEPLVATPNAETEASSDAVQPEVEPSAKIIETVQVDPSPERNAVKIEVLRERYRNATPEQRAAMRKVLRERRKTHRQRLAQ